MSSLTTTDNRIGSMTPHEISRVQLLESKSLERTQAKIETQHVLHGGMYARTIVIPAGVMITGALIKRATILIVDGDVMVHVGSQTTHIKGYKVVAASGNRKQGFYANGDTFLTMVFPTAADDIHSAEEEFTNEASLLMSRNTDAVNYVTVTGE